ncbi:MAG: aldehyde dehydrogenase family protein, partial [Burkholderiales bacterium]|nr:aldehyde dehydrogenase family protein [Phycisphaerae bacterium]
GNALKHDATLLTGGEPVGQCVQATLMENVPRSHPFYSDEAFAPVAILIPYDTYEEALGIVNDSAFGLQAGVFTRDLSRAMTAFHEIEAGSVLINQTPTFRIDNLPYGGVKDSGVGREGPHWAIEDMTELRTLVIKQ